MDRHPNLPPPGRAVQVYQDEAHYPTRVVFVLDTSGSMRGKRMADLRRALAGAVAKLEPGGDTAVYAALERADDELTALIREGDDQVTSIILITDGENTTGSDLTAFRRHRERLRQERCGQRSGDRCQAPVFPVLVAQADPVEMAQVATLTGGKVYDARTVDLAVVLRDLTAGR